MGEKIKVSIWHESYHGYAGDTLARQENMEVGDEPTKLETGERDFVEIKRDPETGILTASHIFLDNEGKEYYGDHATVSPNNSSLKLDGHNWIVFNKVDDSGNQ